MKTVKYLIIFIAMLMSSCDEYRQEIPASGNPEIILNKRELYSEPGRKFVIAATLKDDLGLKSVKIHAPELFLEKTIFFDTDENGEWLLEYDLEYEFKAPEETKREDVFMISLEVEDVSGNIVKDALDLKLDGDFNAPVVSELVPVDGTVMLMPMTGDIDVDLSFMVSDETGLDTLRVIQEELGVDEEIIIGGLKTYHFEKTLSVPSAVEEYILQIIATDTFVEPNRLELKAKFSVQEGLTVLYLADVPKGTDLTADDIVGVPMICHEYDNGEFIFRYYADTDNKEIYFLGQESSFQPHCFGLDQEGKLVNKSDALPVVLPEKGYYEIMVNPSILEYSVSKYTPSSEVYFSDDSRRLIVVANGVTAQTADITWMADVTNDGAVLSNDPDNPYILTKDIELTGSTVQIVVTGAGWSPFWRLDEDGVAVFNGGVEHPYDGGTGIYTLSLDTELSRISITRKK